MPPCKSPWMVGHSHPVPCGQCMSCRVNKRRLWTHRLMLEELCHEHSCFVTLTYEDMPKDKSLDPVHFRNWMKRLRRRIEPKRVRFFGVGEYGDRTERPHYHAALFGLGVDDFVSLGTESWKFGFMHVGELNQKSAGYVCGYTTKKMTAKDDRRLNGRHPEFARMSTRPGIGVPALGAIVEALRTQTGKEFFTEEGDVPTSLFYGERSLPLGRFLRQKLRCLLDMEEVDEYGEFVFKGKIATTDKMASELRALWKDAQSDPQVSADAKASIRHFFIESNRQAVINAETKAAAHKKEKRL